MDVQLWLYIFIGVVNVYKKMTKNGLKPVKFEETNDLAAIAVDVLKQWSKKGSKRKTGRANVEKITRKNN